MATFTDPDTSTPLTNYTALINWGDNTPVTAGSVTGSGGSYTISGGHLYASAGNDTATVTLTDISGHSTSVQDTVTVSAPASTLAVNPVFRH